MSPRPVVQTFWFVVNLNHMPGSCSSSDLHLFLSKPQKRNFEHKVSWHLPASVVSIDNSILLSAVRANFEFLKKLGVERWCFHDRDIAPEGSTLEVLRCWRNFVYKNHMERYYEPIDNVRLFCKQPWDHISDMICFLFLCQESNANLDYIASIAEKLQVYIFVYGCNMAV